MGGGDGGVEEGVDGCGGEVEGGAEGVRVEGEDGEGFGGCEGAGVGGAPEERAGGGEEGGEGKGGSVGGEDGVVADDY